MPDANGRVTVLAGAPRAAWFDANREANLALVAELRERLARVQRGGGDEAVGPPHRARQAARPRAHRPARRPGHAVPRASPLAAWDMYDGEAPSAGIVTGIGVVGGREVAIVANDATVKGGTYFPMTVKKHLRLQEIAAENRLPCVYLVDSRRGVPAAPGRGVPRPRALRPDLLQPGQPVGGRDRADRGRHGLVDGRRRLRAGDERRDGDRQGHGHDLHRRPAAREGGDRRGGERRGPGRRGRPHAAVSGVADHFADDDEHALAIARRILANVPVVRHALPWEVLPPREPLYDPTDLYGIVPPDLRTRRSTSATSSRGSWTAASSTSSRRATARRSSPASRGSGATRWASSPTTASCSARASLKGAHFIELCAKRRIPLVFLQNITGFMVGREYENRGLARDGAKMVMAVANARVPKFTVDRRRLVRGRATTACAAGPTRRASCGCGRTRGSA